MWIICLADDSHEMSYFLWNMHFKVSSAEVVISALRVYSFNTADPQILLKDHTRESLGPSF